MTDTARTHAGLRAWAKGIYPLEAAVELLIRGFGGHFAGEHQPWVRCDATPDGPRYWVAVDQLGEHVADGPLSGGERRYLAIACSLGNDVPVDLSDALPGLDHEHLTLVLAAVSHAGGAHEHRALEDRAVVDHEGQPGTVQLPTGGRLAPLFPWPARD